MVLPSWITAALAAAGSASAAKTSTKTTTTPVILSGTSTYNYAGCWVDQGNPRALTGKSYSSASGMTVQSCLNYCAGSTYAAIEYGDECYCGSSLSSKSSQVADSQCSMTCTGNSTQYCGAGWRLTTYKLKSAGTSSSSSSKLSTSTSKSSTSSSKSSTLSSSSTHSSTSSTKLSSSSSSTSTHSSTPSSTTHSTSSSSTRSSSSSSTRTSSSSSTTLRTSTTSTSTSSKSSSSSTSSTSSSASASASASVIKDSGKRGLPYNTASYTTPFEDTTTSTSLVSWAYNWAQLPSGTLASTFEYVPMLWSNAADLTSSWSSNVASLGTSVTHVLAFNEPDYSEQANMNVSTAVAAWMKYIQPLAAEGYKLGAPAVTNGGSPMGLTWLSQFIGNCTACTIDFVPIHWYDSATNFAYLEYYVQEAYSVAKRPIWITEFEGSGTTDQQISFLKQALPYLDGLNYVERYAWFGAFENNLLNADGTDVSALGAVYKNYTGSS